MMPSSPSGSSGMSVVLNRGSHHAEEIRPATARATSSRVVSLHREDGVDRRVERGRGRRAVKDPPRRADPRGARVPGIRSTGSTARPGDRDIDPRSRRRASHPQLRAAGINALRSSVLGRHPTARRNDPSCRVPEGRRSSRGLVDPVPGSPDAVFRISRNPSRGKSVDHDRHGRRGPRAGNAVAHRSGANVYRRATFRDHRREVGAFVARRGGRDAYSVGPCRSSHGSQTTYEEGSHDRAFEDRRDD